jgi:abhydrolase domain-containing protein 17
MPDYDLLPDLAPEPRRKSRKLEPKRTPWVKVKEGAKHLAILATIFYGCFFLFALFFSDWLIFQPHAPRYADAAEVVKLKRSDGATIAALHLANPSATYTILYCHGNAEDLGDIRPAMEALRSRGFAVFAFDYPGYGLSGGRPGVEGALRAADTGYQYVTGDLRIPKEHVILYGRSLGGAIAIDLASRRAAAGLIVESSFVTAFRVATHLPLLPFDKLRSIDLISKVNCPVLVIHGTNDNIIPAWHGRALFAEARDPKTSLWADGAGHNDVTEVAGGKYWQAIAAFRDMLPAAVPSQD